MLSLTHLLARKPGFDLALLEESYGLIVELYLCTSELTVLESCILVVTNLLHDYEATCCCLPLGNRSATFR